MTYYDHSDVIDFRDLVTKGREYLETWQAVSTSDEEEREEAREALRALEEVADDLGLGGTRNQTYAEMLDALESYAEDEPTAIAAEYFTGYAQELAEDIGAIDANAAWPLRHIDWQAAADELKVDYNSFTLEGNEYFIRAI